MLKFVPLVLKTLWRHRSRTVLTVFGAALTLFVFYFVEAIDEGMNQLERKRASSKSLVVFQANKFCPATSHLPEDYQAVIRKIDGVREVLPIQVFTNNCRASLDVIVFYGLPADRLRAARDFELTAGDWSEFYGRQDAAIVGRAVAARRGVDDGESFSIGDLTVQVAGIFASKDAAEENYIYAHLDFLQRMRGRNQVGTVTQHEVLLEPGARAETICDQIDDRFAAGPVATDTRSKGAFQARSLSDLEQLVTMIRSVGSASIALMLVLVATTTLTSVDDRRREHALLQTLGFSGQQIFGLVLSESFLLSLTGGLFGIVLAVFILAVRPISVAAEAVAVAFEPSWQLTVVGLAVAVAVGLAAGIIPAIHAARTEIVPALRA